MTAINVLVRPEAVHILVDGKVTNMPSVGVPKCFPMPHAKAAIATRGQARLLGLMTLALSARSQTFDAMAADLHNLQAIVAMY